MAHVLKATFLVLGGEDDANNIRNELSDLATKHGFHLALTEFDRAEEHHVEIAKELGVGVCYECGHFFDDNENQPVCKTCEDFLSKSP